LAVKSADSVNSSRAVKYLLVGGADTSVRDNARSRAIDLVEGISIFDLRNEIRNMLVRDFFISFCFNRKVQQS
jgi:hypothetical protein